MTAQARRPRIPGVLRNRSFALFISARLISQFGDQLYTFAITWYILRATQSSVQMAIPLILNTVITAVVALLGGFAADRWNRKQIMVRTDLAQGVVLTVMALMMLGNRMQVWMIYPGTAILAFCSAIFSPAASAVIPDIAGQDQILEATSANQFTISFCAMAGMLAGGFLYGAFGMVAILIFNAASNFLSAFLESMLKIPARPAKQIAPPAGAIRDAVKNLRMGLSYVRGQKAISDLLVVNFVFNLISLPVGLVLIPYFFNVILRTDALHLAIPQAALWLGMILSSLAIPVVLRRRSLPATLRQGLAGMCLCTLAGAPLVLLQAAGRLGSDAPVIVWTVINLCCGASVNLFIVPLYALFQTHASGEYRGRFWGIEQSVRTLALCSGYLIAGLLSQNFPLGAVLIAYSVVTLALVIWVNSLKSIGALSPVAAAQSAPTA